MYQQPYDQLMKDMFKEDTESLLAFLLPGATFLDMLDIEVLRAPMRMDRVCRMKYKGKTYLLNLEFQADEDDDMAHRLHVYHANLWREHKLPIISLVFYLFRCPTVTSPLVEDVGEGEEALKFHFVVYKLWEFDSRKFVKEHPIDLYPWLPAMDNTDADFLVEAIDQMVEYYRGQEVTLARKILWFSYFFRRGSRLSLPEKQKVEERLKMLEQLLEQDEWVLKQKALSERKGFIEGEQKGERNGFAKGEQVGLAKGEQVGLAKGEQVGLAKGEQVGIAKGELKTLRETLIMVVQMRYPTLTELAEQKASSTQELDVLRHTIKQVLGTSDEAFVHYILNSLGD